MAGQGWQGRERGRGKPPEKHLLDVFTLADIHQWSTITSARLQAQWKRHSDTVFQRSRIAREIREALLGAAVSHYEFGGWQRVVRHQYTLDPLSPGGSLKDPGGRFNIGEIDRTRLTPFPALYIAGNKTTALQEALCGVEDKDGLKGLDYSLTRPESITCVAVGGNLELVIDLHEPKRLEPFVDLIKDFRIAEDHYKEFEKAHMPEPTLVRDSKTLLQAVLDPNWRFEPMQFDIPSPSQVFGQLVADAGVCGIVYPSKLTGRIYAAIFPQNFQEGGSYVELQGIYPKEVRFPRLDAIAWANMRCR